MRRNTARLSQNLPALHFLALSAAQQHADVVTGLTFVQSLRNISIPVATVFWVGLKPTISISSPTLIDSPLNPAGHHRTATADCENILDRHNERLVNVSSRLLDERIHSFHEFQDCALAHLGCIALQRL